jgi:RNA polymerase sigma-70 factor (ECF subfamily)
VSDPARRAQADAFERHVVPHVEVLYRVALSLTGQPADAEDLVQDTLVRAFGAVDRFDGAYPRAWLLTILRNANLNRNRRRRPALLRDGESAAAVMDRLTPSAPASEDIVISNEFEAVVADALAALPDKHRAVVALVDIDGLTYQEAADALGIPRGTVMSRLHRARARIRARLALAGTISHPRRM